MSTKSDQIQGHAKSVAGIVTGNEDLQSEGATQTREADAAARLDDAKDQAVELIDHVKDKLDDVADKAKDSVHNT